MAQPNQPRTPTISPPTHAQHPSTHILQSAGVAIFHLRSSRVVVCHHSRDRYWFLPKGRRDVGEGLEAAGEREGFEESGYLNRLLPLPLPHLQTHPGHVKKEDREVNVTEPAWVQLLPHRTQSRAVQYILYWYIAETVPPDTEAELSAAMQHDLDVQDDGMSLRDTGGHEAMDVGERRYHRPPPFPSGTKLSDRIALEPEDYEPRRHAGTGVDEEEALYESSLLSVDEALRKLRGTVEGDVVRIGWEAIKKRLETEKQESE